jgi:hypothetical protein
LRARGYTASAVAEVLIKGGIVFLHTGSGRCIGVGQTAIDHIEATLPFVQSQLKIGSAASRVVLVAPLDIEDSVGSNAADRCKDTKPGV